MGSPKNRNAMRTGLLIVVALVVLATPAVAKSYDHPLIEQTFQLLPNGDADVTEIRTFRFEGSFSWAAITRHTRGQYGRYALDYRGVWDADTRQPLSYQVTRDGSDVTLRWSYAAQDTTKRFLIRYRIGGAVQRYQDVAQFYWQAVEGDHAPLDAVRITLIPPHPSPALFKVFIHSKAAPGGLTIAPDFRQAVITQSSIPESSFVEVRALLDPTIFPQAAMQSGQDYENLLADERKQSQRELTFGRTLLALITLAVVLVAGLIGGYIWTYLRYGREPEVSYDAPYEHDAPRPLPPAVVPAILTQGKVENRELSKAFAATLLEAARLGYLEIEEVQDQGLLGTGLFRDTDLVYRLTAKGQTLMDGGTPELRSDERPLMPFELSVLDAVFKRAGSGSQVTSDQIETWGKRITGSKSNFLRFIELWGPQLRGYFERSFFKLDDASSERAKTIFIGVTIAVMVIVFFVGFGVSLFVAGPVGVVLIALAYKSLSRRTPEAALEVKRWEAFRRFMTDFSAMKDAGPRLLPLWEHYLVYATALGVAERLLHNLKLVAAELRQSVPAPGWYRSPSLARGMTTLPVASLESLTRSFQNFQNLSRALSSSTSSGGGFSGGGGGGGGGGGSRAG